MITIEIEKPDLRLFGEECMALVRPVVRTVMADLALDLWQRMRIKLGGIGRGLFYTRMGRTHQASAPGDPPAKEFGDYLNSWTPVLLEEGDEITAGIYSEMFGEAGDPKRGRFLEYGTENMQPRPHVGPVSEEWEVEAQRKLDAIDRLPYGGPDASGRFRSSETGRFVAGADVLEDVARALGSR